MNILILSANTGQGHNSCAEAIRECIEAHGDTCAVVDTFGLISEKLSRSIAKSHERNYRQTPKLSGAGYRFLEKHPELFSRKQLVYQVMRIGSRQIARCIREGGYDAVLCTHVLAAMSLTAAIQYEALRIKSAFIATDYSCSPGMNGTQLDRYFIPHASLKDDFLKAGVPAESLIIAGMPVKKAYRFPSDKHTAKRLFDIHPAHQHLLMMCGSMGCGPIPDLLRTISAQMPNDWEITVVCGTNEALKAQLEKAHSLPGIHIRGYVKEMPLLLSSADLYLTKPGGLSTSEAFASAVPMVLVDAVAGCEANNLRHFVNLGAAITGETVDDVANACLGLMRNPQQLDSMVGLLKAHAPMDSAQIIWQELQNMP